MTHPLHHRLDKLRMGTPAHVVYQMAALRQHARWTLMMHELYGASFEFFLTRKRNVELRERLREAEKMLIGDQPGHQAFDCLIVEAFLGEEEAKKGAIFGRTRKEMERHWKGALRKDARTKRKAFEKQLDASIAAI